MSKVALPHLKVVDPGGVGDAIAGDFLIPMRLSVDGGQVFGEALPRRGELELDLTPERVVIAALRY